jgi:Adenylate and Guanylate cyclase catalytic domain
MKLSSLLALDATRSAIGNSLVGLSIQRHPNRKAARLVVSNDLNATNGLTARPFGRAHCIQITRSTYDLVKDAFDCKAMGTIEVKGAGQMEIWHVLGGKKPITAATSAPSGAPC